MLDFALWVDRISVKKAIKISSYSLGYSIGPMLPIHLELPTLKN